MNIPWRTTWSKNKAYWFEWFLIFNLTFLAADILVAHAVNNFRRQEEWVPFAFSIISPLILIPIAFTSLKHRSLVLGRWAVTGMGLLSIVIGIAGLVYHMESQFLRGELKLD